MAICLLLYDGNVDALNRRCSFHHEISEASEKLNFNLRQFGDVIAASLMMMAGSFILIYGKTLDWFDNYYIRLAAILFLLSTAALILLRET